MDLFQFVDTPEEGFEALKAGLTKYHLEPQLVQKEQKDEGPEARGYGQGYEYFGMALNFTIAILLFGAGGWFLDGWVHTRPLFAIVGFVIGTVGWFVSLYYRVQRDTEREKHGEGRRGSGPG